MFLFSRLSVLTLLSSGLSSFAAPSLVSRQGGSEQTGWTDLPAVEGATVYKDWDMLGATFVCCF